LEDSALTGNRNTKARKSRKQIIFRWIKGLVITYCVIGLAAYLLQDHIIIQPLKLTSDYKFNFDFPHKELNIPYNHNTNINIVQFTPKDTVAKGVVLYFHGNKNNIYRYRRFVPYFTKWGYEVWMIDYPGFGKSTGKFTEDLVYKWSLMMYEMARKKFTAQQIVIYGKSLGTGIAAQLASVTECKKLILETPYYSMTSLAEHYLWMYPISRMLHYRLPTNNYLLKVTEPVTVFHGTEDELIPYSNAIRLKSVLKKEDEFITIPGGTHRNLNNFPAMNKKLDSLLQY
jgi:alpha-beta hydrolase superfamily lysophospholipase